MSLFDDAIAYIADPEKRVSRDARILAQHFPHTTLVKWASFVPRDPVSKALHASGRLVPPHPDYQTLVDIAAAVRESDRYKAAKLASALGDRVTCDNGMYTHHETGFRSHPGFAKSASTAPAAVPAPTIAPVKVEAPRKFKTGPEAILEALSRRTPDDIEQEGRALLEGGKKTHRSRAIDLLNIAEGMRRNAIEPKDLMISKVPVIPATFRPFSVVGDRVTLGDANELYRDLINSKDAFMELNDALGGVGVGEDRLRVMDAVRATYGFGEPTNPKTKARGVKGFLQQVTGTGPKHSWVNSKMLAKPMDQAGRGVIVPDPNLGLNEISLPEDMAWNAYGQWVQRRLVRGGTGLKDAVLSVKNRDNRALAALKQEMLVRPVVYSRSPAWHKFNIIAAWPKMHKGSVIKITPYTTDGLSGDFDGDTVHVHVPIYDATVNEVKEKLMPSKMLFSIKSPGDVVPKIKHEQIGGLFSAKHRAPKRVHTFANEQEALQAIESNRISLSDEVILTGQPPRHAA